MNATIDIPDVCLETESLLLRPFKVTDLKRL